MAVNKGRGTTEISRRVPEVPDNAPTEIKTFLEELIRYLQSYAWEQDFGAPDSIGTSKLMDESVTEVKLEDDSVSLAKLSSGTAGKFIGYDVSGNPEEKDAPTTADENVKITASDTTSGFLNDKLSGVGLTKTIINPGADEILQLSIDNASQPEAVAGTNNTKGMTPLRVSQAIDANVAFSLYEEIDIGSITASSRNVIAHSLGIEPKGYQLVLECLVAELGYSPGDKIVLNPQSNNGNTAAICLTTTIDASNIIIRQEGFPAYALVSNEGATSISSLLTFSNWKILVRVWA